MRRTGTRTVFLDMTGLDAGFLKQRFPTIDATCKQLGLDISKDQLPVSPASHYCMGGVRTDLWGRSTLPGLYAAGEVSCTGVHGANRLASNSLLEGLVFGARAGAAALRDGHASGAPTRHRSEPEASDRQASLSTAVKKRVKRIMWDRVGIIRDSASLSRAIREFEQIASAKLSTSSRNFVTIANLVATAALWREESRGGHYRSDFPDRSDAWQTHSLQQVDEEISSTAKINFDTGRAV